MNCKPFTERIEQGLIPAVPVPFDAQGGIDEAAQQAYIAWMAGQPVAGVALWVHTGRGLRLTREQRIAVLAAWRRGLPPALPVIAGAGAPAALAADPRAYWRAAREMAEDAAAGGAAALLVHPPRVSVSEIVRYHAELARLGLPLLLFYLYEAAGGVAYSDALLRELLSLPQVAGIKMATLDSVIRYQEVSRLLAEFPGRLLITGEDRFLGYSFMRGARAALVGIGAACCDLLAAMIGCWFSGRADKFLRLSSKVDELAEAAFVHPMEGYIQRMLLVLAEQGILPAGATFDPWGPPLDRAAEVIRIRHVLNSLSSHRHEEHKGTPGDSS